MISILVFRKNKLHLFRPTVSTLKFHLHVEKCFLMNRYWVDSLEDNYMPLVKLR